MKRQKPRNLAPTWRGLSPSLFVVALFVCVGVSVTNTPILGAGATGVGPASWENDLSPITSADWDYDKAAHLLERAGFGGTPEEIEALAAMTPQAAVDWVVHYQRQADTAPTFEPSPIWDSGMDPFPKSRADAVRIARETGQSMGVPVLPEGESCLLYTSPSPRD